MVGVRVSFGAWPLDPYWATSACGPCGHGKPGKSWGGEPIPIFSKVMSGELDPADKSKGIGAQSQFKGKKRMGMWSPLCRQAFHSRNRRAPGGL